MKLLKYSLFFLIAAVAMTSCTKKDTLPDPDTITGLGGDTWVNGPIDNWVLQNYVDPYNISVKYKWDQSELDLNKHLVPPKEEKVIPLMQSIKSVWIDNYIAEAGALFFKKYCPKFFVLVGSVQYNTNGSITLGQAEGGRRIEIFGLNDFNIKGMPGYKAANDSDGVKMKMHTIEHEFGHILHQNIMYPQEFKKICVGQYTANWNNIEDSIAQKEGFVTSYAMNGTDDDWVETIAILLIEGHDGFDRLVNSIHGTSDNGTTAATAQARLRQKESMIVNYYKDIWGIDFYSLQKRTRASVEALLY
ncbi:zinc-binding metallopeptidase [Pinibacter soli]|uniref:Zinc-binding metallopeptidase n=1 Tax=Pinibacter soli TaxID=3044211 RepID=A0ABT6RH33_9BACT|nr:putative zinc-binding metallopeptidase [Pinibacter soli]MDI3321882.1 putative zinc-binding metallopeptidase [Pinibacter soli]